MPAWRSSERHRTLPGAPVFLLLLRVEPLLQKVAHKLRLSGRGVGRTIEQVVDDRGGFGELDE